MNFVFASSVGIKRVDCIDFERNKNIIQAVPCKNVSSGICGQQRPRSACASMQSDQGLHCLLTESLDTTECMNGEPMLG